MGVLSFGATVMCRSLEASTSSHSIAFDIDACSKNNSSPLADCTGSSMHVVRICSCKPSLLAALVGVILVCKMFLLLLGVFMRPPVTDRAHNCTSLTRVLQNGHMDVTQLPQMLGSA